MGQLVQPLATPDVAHMGEGGKPATEFANWLQQADKLLRGKFTGALLSADDAAGARQVLGLAYGKQSIWVPAGAMLATQTSGAAPGNTETAVNKVQISGLDFAKSARQFAQFTATMPKSWDQGPVTAIFWWAQTAAGVGSVVWGLQAVAIPPGNMDVAFGSAVELASAGGTSGNDYMSDESAAMTVAGTLSPDVLTYFQVYRNVTSPSDTLAINARLLGVRLLYGTDAASDS
jgi:hypothetical protein